MKNIKNIKYILIFVLCFFCLNFNVSALSKQELDNIIENMTLEVSKNDSYCVYKHVGSQNSKNDFCSVNNNTCDGYGGASNVINKNKQYFIVKVHKSTETNNFELSFYKDEEDRAVFTDQISSFNNCSDYVVIFKYNNAGSYAGDLSASSFYFYKNSKNYDMYPFNIYEYNQELQSKLDEKINVNENIVTYEIKIPNTTYYAKFDSNSFETSLSSGSFYIKATTNGYSTKSIKICPVYSDDDCGEYCEGYHSRYSVNELTSFKENFRQSNWQLFSDSSLDGGNSNCDYFLTSINDNLDKISSSEVEVEGDLITKYVSYNSDEAPYINIIKKDESLKYEYIKNKNYYDVSVSNDSSYKNMFLNANSLNYPKYIVCTDVYKNCRFSSEKGDGTKAGGETTYININYIGSIVGLGEKSVIETCEELIGDTFIDFLKNNIFKVLYIIIPIILIVLTTFDFAKAVFSENKDGLQKAFKMFIRRVIASILILLVPTILIFVTNIFGNSDVKKCVEIFQNSATSS